MNEAMAGMQSATKPANGDRKISSSEKALAELRVYFAGSRGKLRVLGFVCQVLIASVILFALISLIDLGSVMLHAILLVSNSSLTGVDYAQRFLMEMPAKTFVAYTTDSFVHRSPFNALASLMLTATAETYWTMRRASRLMPPAQAFAHD